MTFISRDSQEDTRVFHGPVINKSIRTFKFENGVGIGLKTRALPVCRGMKGVYTCVLGRVKSEGNGARFPWIAEMVLELQGSGRKKNSPSQNGGCAGERKRDDRLENGRRGKNDGPSPCRDARKKTNSLIFCHSITAEIRIQVEVFCRIRAPPAPFPSTPF